MTDDPAPAVTLSFRDTDEMNLWNQWVSISIQYRETTKAAVKEADDLIEAFRQRGRGFVLQSKPGRA